MWNTFIFLAFLLFSVNTPHSMTYAATANTDVTLYCYDGSAETFSIFSLDNPVPLLNSSCYDPAKKTLFFTFGFTDTPDDPYVRPMVEVHLLLSYNVVLVNWENQAAGGPVVVLGYLRAARNAGIFGARFGRALVQLVQAGLERVKIVIVGFSLGAPFMGYATREFQRISGQFIVRAVGLDPARPLYDGPLSLRNLDAGSAIFVLIVHTNPGAMGTVEIAGTVDFFANCGTTIQPGCENATGGDTILIMSPPNSCSHNRSWMHYVESLQNPNTFIGRSADGKTLALGDQIPLSARGTYFYKTNAAPLYARGLEGASAVPDS